MTHAVQRFDEVFAGADGLPMQTASEFLILLSEIEEVLIKLDRVNRDPPLLGG